MSNKHIGQEEDLALELMMRIVEYCRGRNYVMPDVWQAMGWVNTEIGEVYELLLARAGNWVRNNPQNKEPFSRQRLEEELGDVIFMIMLAGYSEGLNPLEGMNRKMTRKLSELSMKKSQTDKTVTGVSSVVPVTDAEAERIFRELGDIEEELRED